MHVSLQNSVDFYILFFGIPPVKVKPGYAKFVLEHPSLIISFVENKERVQANFGHLGFQVETLDALNERLAVARTLNIVAKAEMGTNCCYATQDKFWVNDPDGVQWEVYYFHADADFNDPHYQTTQAEACCIVSSENVNSACGCTATVAQEKEKEQVACC